MPRGKVKRIIDGDTFVLRGGERVRIAELNAPELGERGGQTAKQKLRQKMPPGTEVGLSKPVAKSYGRNVRKVTVDGRNVAKTLGSARSSGSSRRK